MLRKRKARKEYLCSGCMKRIAQGDEYFAYDSPSTNKFFKWCKLCNEREKQPAPAAAISWCSDCDAGTLHDKDGCVQCRDAKLLQPDSEE